MRFIITFLSILIALLLTAIGIGSASLVDRLHKDPDKMVRMAHVRLFPSDLITAVVRDYATRLPEYSDILILGDSQTYGVDLAPSKTLAAYLRNERWPNVFNMSMVGADFANTARVVEILKQEKKRFRYTVININPVHFKSGAKEVYFFDDKDRRSLLLSAATTSDINFFSPVLKIDLAGISLIGNENWNVYTLDFFQRATPLPLGFNEKRVKRDYYLTLDATSPVQMLKALKAATEVSDRVIAFASPTSYNVYNLSPYHWNWDVRPTIRDALRHCRSVERTTCLDWSNVVPHRDFADVIHLLPEGHRILAEKISEVVLADSLGGPFKEVE